jgi:hypothetical protein
MTTTRSHLSAVSRIDEYAGTFDVTDTLVVSVGAEPETVREALDRVDLTAPVTRALEALGVADRLALPPSLLAAKPGTGLVLGLVWRVAGPAKTIDARSVRAFDLPGHVKMLWDLRVEPGAGDGALLSTTRRFIATDDAARARLLGAWGVIGTFAQSLSQRTLTAIKRYAEDRDDFGHATRPRSIGSLRASPQNMPKAA